MAIRFLETSAEYLTVPNESDYDLSVAMSISLFAKTDGTWINSWENLVSKGDSSWRLSKSDFGAGRGIHWATSGTSGDGGGSLNWDGTFDDSAWHHLVVTYFQGAPGRKRIILDGVVVAEDLALTGTLSTDAYQVYIGENSQATGREFDGWMHDVRIYDRELILPEAQAIRIGGGGDNVLDYISRWVGDQGYPTEVISGSGAVMDLGPLGNDATPVATPEWAESPYRARRRRAA